MENLDELLIAAWHSDGTVSEIAYRLGRGFTARRVRRAFERMQRNHLVPSRQRACNKDIPPIERQKPYTTLDARGVDKLLEKLQSVHVTY